MPKKKAIVEGYSTAICEYKNKQREVTYTCFGLYLAGEVIAEATQESTIHFLFNEAQKRRHETLQP
jgi:hypothetical protein